MSSPVATIADALIAFILSLLRDPEAAEEFAASPGEMMATSGVDGACLADLRAVTPVIIDHPTVTPKDPDPPTTPEDPDSPEDPDHEVVREIQHLVNNFTSIDARTTIIDQSVNQNIWTEGGDVTQLFDQSAVVASGDESMAAGDDLLLDQSDTDITTGDISIGNTSNADSFNDDHSDNSTIDSSFNDSDIETTSPTAGDDDDSPTPVPAVDGALPTDADAAEAVETVLDVATSISPASAPSVPEPADVLETDMTAGDDVFAADSTASVTPEPEPMYEAPIEES